MPDYSIVYLYGTLSGASCTNINPNDLIYRNLTLKGFWITNYISSLGTLGLHYAFKNILQELSTVFKPTIYQEYYIYDIQSAIDSYYHNSSKGKIIINPHPHQ